MIEQKAHCSEFTLPIGDYMRKLIIFVICIFAFSFVTSCTAERPTERPTNQDGNDAMRTCFNRYFSINSIKTSGYVVMFHITNTSHTTITIFEPDFLQLHPIENGEPKDVHSISNFMIYKDVGGQFKIPEYDDQGLLRDGGKPGLQLKPGESIFFKQTMPSPFTKCDDYAITFNDAYGYIFCGFYKREYARLSCDLSP